MKEKATKPRIVAIFAMYITASECNDGVVVLDGYQRSACINAIQSLWVKDNIF